MKIYWPAIWSPAPGVDYSADALSLAAILPVAGQTRTAFFSYPEELPSPAPSVYLLWQPPHSMYNGWDEQPSEIASSFLLEAKVLRMAERGPDGQGYEVEILAHQAFLPTLKAMQGFDADWELSQIYDATQTPPRILLNWDEVHWCGMAQIAGLIYIAANTRAESHLELIMEEVDGELIGLFHYHVNPGGAECDLGRRKLSAKESRSVRAAMRKAHPLVDRGRPYLID